MASWGNLERSCRLGRKNHPRNEKVQQVFREGMKNLRVMVFHVPYTMLKLMINYHNSFTEIQEIGLDQWIEEIIALQDKYATECRRRGWSSYDQDRREKQLTLYRDTATVPELKKRCERETWETLNRDNVGVRFVKAWNLNGAIQAYLDRFSDPDEVFDKAACLCAIGDVTRAVGDAMNKQRGAPDKDDLSPKLVYWELIKMMLHTCIEGGGNDITTMDHTAIKAYMGEVGVDVSMRSPNLLLDRWLQPKFDAPKFDDLYEYTKALLLFDMTESKVADLSVNLHKYCERLDEQAQKKDDAKLAAADLSAAESADAGGKRRKGNKVEEKTPEEKKPKIVLTQEQKDQAEADKRRKELLGDSKRKAVWAKLSELRDSHHATARKQMNFFNELCLVVDEATSGLDEPDDEALAGAFAIRPLLIYAMTRKFELPEDATVTAGSEVFSDVFAYALEKIGKLKGTSSSGGNLSQLSGKELGMFFLN